MSTRNLDLANALARRDEEIKDLRAALAIAQGALSLFVGENGTHTETERIVAGCNALVVIQQALRR